MFSNDSRYANRPLKTLIDDQGREVSYVERRIIPQDGRAVAEIRTQDGDRLDLIANRALGDPRAAWRIMDANPDPEPLKLADTPRRILKLNQVEG